MKTLYLKRSAVSGKCKLVLISCIILLCYCGITQVSPASAQAVLFDFDNAPLYTSLPVNLTVSGITAHLSATGQGYSIQNANVLGFTPQGFAGRIIYPNSISLAYLLISYDQTLSEFSIMYACQELGCDDAATMRVTAYVNGSFVGTSTKTASNPGTWPSDTLRCSFPQGFNSVVVHYASRPPTCQDYGMIYMADNMSVTRLTANPLSLNLTSIIEGFWDGTFMVIDSVKVYLRNAASPYDKVDSSMTVLNNSGNGILLFSNAAGGNYYIVVTQRNSIVTWSGQPKTFTAGGSVNYSFTTAASQAFGSNLILKSGKYCIYNGDVNLDGIIDAGDLSEVDNDALNSVTGYVATDTNGDEFVDAADLSLVDNNVTLGIVVISP